MTATISANFGRRSETRGNATCRRCIRKLGRISIRPSSACTPPLPHCSRPASLSAWFPRTDAEGTESPQETADIPTKFLAALAGRLGKAEARSWLTGVTLCAVGEEWELRAPSAFKADWIRAQFAQALEHARSVAGLDRSPAVVAQQ